MTAPEAPTPTPTVVLVGAGPGDVDLFTLDATSALVAARVVVADRSLGGLLAALVADGTLDQGAGPRVTWVDDDRPAADVILDALATATAPTAATATSGSIVRLYRGDPWFHPAGDGERAALCVAGIAWTSLPGVIEEVAALAAAGIPVQLRTTSVATTFVVDDEAAGLAPPADPAHTLVVRTSDLAGAIGRLAGAMVDPAAAGRPAAAIATSGHPGTDRTHTPVVRANLGGLADASAVAGLCGPGVIVLGLVAALDTRSDASTDVAPQPVPQPAAQPVSQGSGR